VDHLNEALRPVQGFPGYFAGDLGNVYSSWEGSGPGARPHGRLRKLKPAFSSGRMQVNLHRDGRSYTRRVHLLVLEAFAGPRPPGMQGCHFPDRDTRNNALANLRWDTASANQVDKVAHGTSNRGVRNGRWSRLTEQQVSEIRRRHAAGERQKDLAVEFCVSAPYVSNIVRRDKWAWARS
jgi:hypothetical protein